MGAEKCLRAKGRGRGTHKEGTKKHTRGGLRNTLCSCRRGAYLKRHALVILESPLSLKKFEKGSKSTGEKVRVKEILL